MRNVFALLAVCVIMLISCQMKEPQPQEQFDVSFGPIEYQVTSESAVVTTTLPTVMLNNEGLVVEESALALLWCEASATEETTVGDFRLDGDNIVFELNELSPNTTYVVRLQYDAGSRGVFCSDAASFTTLSVVPGPEPGPEPEAVVLPYLSGIYYGNYYGATENDYNYSLILATAEDCYDIISGDVVIDSESQYLFLDLYASISAEEYNVRFEVPEGDYVIDAESSCVSGTLSGEYTFLYTSDYNSGQEVFFADGVVTVSADGIEAHLVANTGEEYHFSCPMRSVDNSQNFGPSFSPPEQSTLDGDLTIEFTESTIAVQNYGDYYVVGKNNWYLYIKDDATGDSFSFELLASFDDAMLSGVFPVTNDLNQRQMILPGYVDAQDSMWSWYLFYADYTNITESAPIVDGQIEIIDNGDGTITVDIDVVDDMGYHITGSCTDSYLVL